METYQDLKSGERGAWLSITAYLILSALKLSVGLLYGSKALVADGLNNSTDVAASVAVLIGLRISSKPPDQDHRYGHSRAETIAALIASVIMIGASAQVIFQAMQNMFTGSFHAPDPITAWTALFCALAMFAVHGYNLRLGKRINSKAILATAQDNKSDALVSVGAFVGIIGSHFGMPWLDPAAAIAVGIMIGKTGIDILRDSAHALTDGFDENELRKFRKTIEKTSGVRKVTDIRARVHGNNILLDVTILVDSRLNVVQSHDISDRIEQRMLDKHNIEHVHIHIEPEETARI